MTIAIIDYGSGNLRSVAKAFEAVATNHSVLVTKKPSDLVIASHIVLPGVGAYADCMSGLTALEGMIDTLAEQVLVRKKNFLGICVGMQMMFERGLEHGTHEGLGWLKGDVVRIQDSGFRIQKEKNNSLNPESRIPNPVKIPHMGWNELEILREHPIMRSIKNGDHAYFVHSYAAHAKVHDIIAATQYGQMIPAVVGKEHMVGTQFHPEKSQAAGLTLLKNFIEM